MKRIVWVIAAAAAEPPGSGGPAARFPGDHHQDGERPAMAVPDFRGDGQAQAFMGAFNQTLWSDLDGSGLFKMVPKTHYPGHRSAAARAISDAAARARRSRPAPRRGQMAAPPRRAAGCG